MQQIENNQPKDNDHYKSMYLNTLIQQSKHLNKNNSSLDVSDIEGARCKFIQKPYKIRQSYLNQNYDIEKSQCRVLIPSKSSLKNSMSIDDIEGAHPQMNKFKTTRTTNPLNPIYQLPIVEFSTIEEPKFIRNTLQIDDIDGVRTKETFVRKMQRAGKFTQNKLDCYLGSRKRKYRKNSFENNRYDPIDINKKQDKNNCRHTNPLQPQYNLSKQQSHYGFIEKSKVDKQKHQFLKSNTLKTYDIEGTLPKYNNFIVPPKNIIEGSKTQTLKRGISTNRKTNPLQPKYNYPGDSQFVSIKKNKYEKFDAFIR